MAEHSCYRLAPRGSFHIGARGVGLEESEALLHSDTLFSALCLALLELGVPLASRPDEVEHTTPFLELFPRLSLLPDGSTQAAEPVAPFRLSSAFPVAGSVMFFPRPMLRMQLSKEVNEPLDPRLVKQVKKVRFLSQKLFELVMAGETLVEEMTEVNDGRRGLLKPLILQDGLLWASPEEREKLRDFVQPDSGQVRLWEEERQPHVALDRTTNRSVVFSAGQVRFRPGAGLAFLVEYSDPTWKPVLEKALRLLGDRGLGGERSSGHGQYDLEPAETYPLSNLPGHYDGFTTLSLYWPTPDEVQADILEGSAYNLVQRRGWMASPQAMNLRRKGLRMLAEGAVFKERPGGALANVTPDPAPGLPTIPHQAWRYGLAFPVPCRLAQEQDGLHE